MLVAQEPSCEEPGAGQPAHHGQWHLPAASGDFKDAAATDKDNTPDAHLNIKEHWQCSNAVLASEQPAFLCLLALLLSAACACPTVLLCSRLTLV